MFLDGIPNLQRLSKVNVGETVKEQLELDLALERDAIVRLNAGIEIVKAEGDSGSRILLEQILVSEEEHIDWLEQQLELIEKIGLPNYQQLMVEPA